MSPSSAVAHDVTEGSQLTPDCLPEHFESGLLGSKLEPTPCSREPFANTITRKPYYLLYTHNMVT